MTGDEQLRMCRSGGHSVSRVTTDAGRSELQVVIHRTGPAYGVWIITSDSDEVEIGHYLPIDYLPNGGFGALVQVPGIWTVPAADWRANPAIHIDDLVGKKVAHDIAEAVVAPERDDWNSTPLRLISNTGGAA